MIWFSNENIDIEMIIYNRSILGDINESISSSDQENDKNEKVDEKINWHLKRPSKKRM